MNPVSASTFSPGGIPCTQLPWLLLSFHFSHCSWKPVCFTNSGGMWIHPPCLPIAILAPLSLPRPHDGILLSQEEELSSPQVGRPLPYHPLFWDLGQRSPLTASGLNLIINKMSIKKIPYSEILEME